MTSRKQKLATLAGVLGSGLAIRAALASWCDRRDVAPALRSPLLPMVSLPYTRLTLPIWRNSFGLTRWAGPGVRTLTRRFGDDPTLAVRVSTPTGPTRKRPVVIWLHSGGMIAGSPQFEGPTAGMLARRLDAVVVAPDYRLAPEHPFPAALDDCVSTVKWVVAHAELLGVDPDRVVLAGASAGGGLAATCAQRCADEGIRIHGQALLYPMLDDLTALRPGTEGVAWSYSSNGFAWNAYLGTTPDPDHALPYSSASRRKDLAGTPPTWIGVGDIDILCTEATEYCGRLRDTGVPCELVTVAGMYHAADILVPWANPVRTMLSSMIDHLHGQLG